jgi:bacillithiol system protein YtxJ
VNNIKSLSELESIILQKSESKVLLFKHSPRCGVSLVVKSILQKWLKEQDSELLAFSINVISNRDISNQLATHFDVRHESPQLFYIRNQELIWHGSHFEISKSNLNKYILN